MCLGKDAHSKYFLMPGSRVFRFESGYPLLDSNNKTHNVSRCLIIFSEAEAANIKIANSK